MRLLLSPCVDILREILSVLLTRLLCSMGVAQDGSLREAVRGIGATQGTRSNPWKNCKKFQFWARPWVSLVGASPTPGSWQCHWARVAATWTGCSKLWSGLCLGKDENTPALTDTDICDHNAQLPHGKKELSQPEEPCSPNLTFRGKVLKSLVGH